MYLRETLGDSMSQELSDFLDSTLKEMEDKIKVIQSSYEQMQSKLELEKRAGLITEEEYKQAMLDSLNEELAIMEQQGATELDILEVKAKIYELTNAQNDAESTKNKLLSEQLRNLHKQRQELIFKARLGTLTAADQQNIKDIEKQIIDKMTSEGASQESIDAVIKSFAAASYDVGSPFVPKDQIAKVHKGERIFTNTENKQLINQLNLLSSMISAIKQPMYDVIGNYQTTKQSMELSKITYGGNTGVFAPEINVTVGGSNAKPQEIARYTLDELKKYHKDWHRATGNSNGR
jgi:hypothetical protein